MDRGHLQDHLKVRYRPPKVPARKHTYRKDSIQSLSCHCIHTICTQEGLIPPTLHEVQISKTISDTELVCSTTHQ